MRKPPSSPRWIWQLSSGSGSGKARGLLRGWFLLDALLRYRIQTTAIPGATNDLFRLRITTYLGTTFTLPDGTTVVHGDRIGEIHVHSANTARIMGREQIWGLIRRTREDLTVLARWIQTEEFVGIQAIMGVTLLYPIAERLGFVIRPYPMHWYTPIERVIFQGWIVIYSPGGIQRMEHGILHEQYPREVWFSCDALIRMYGHHA